MTTMSMSVSSTTDQQSLNPWTEILFQEYLVIYCTIKLIFHSRWTNSPGTKELYLFYQNTREIRNLYFIRTVLPRRRLAGHWRWCVPFRGSNGKATCPSKGILTASGVAARRRFCLSKGAWARESRQLREFSPSLDYCSITCKGRQLC